MPTDTLRVNARHLLSMGALAVSAYLFATPATAVTVRDISLDHTQFGNLDQDDVPVCKDGSGNSFSCGPTAAVNSFVWLQNRYPDVYGNNLIETTTMDLDGDSDVDEYDHLIHTAIQLSDGQYMSCAACTGGTTITNFINGKKKWIEERVPGASGYAEQNVHRTGTYPTWRFIYDSLKAGADLEMLIGFYDTDPATPQRLGGHYVTVTSFHWRDIDMDDIIDPGEGLTTGSNAQIDFIDPATGMRVFSDIFQNMLNGPLGMDYGIGGDVDITVIEAAVYENVPEPGTLALLASGMLIWGRLRGRQRRRG